ncbi:MAG TPA: hypothetical protein VFT95_03285, partial [Micromonosporaceae bacterium]|nr:hypothetical protein [Micromonosporaceae bacterium]
DGGPPAARESAADREPARPAGRPQEQAAAPPRPVPSRTLRSVAVPLAAAAVVLSTVLFGLTTSARPDRHAAAFPAAPAPAVPKPAEQTWSQFPEPVPAEFFGVTTASSTGTMPSFAVGSVRFWDSRTRWANLQPRPGEYDWRILDRLVLGATEAGLPAVLTFGGTPAWASPTGARSPYNDESRASPPDDLAVWDAFVGAVAGRYRGRIGAYEAWVFGNDPRYYAGDVRTLVDMTRRAYRIIKRLDPAATVVCPSMGRLWDPAAVRTMEEFARLGGYRHCDAAGVKLHQVRASDPPETVLRLVERVDRVLHAMNVHPPLWSTGTAYEIALEQPLDDATAADFAVRLYLAGLYARYHRLYFYNWGGTKIPIVLQPEGESPTRAALYVEELQRWLGGARIAGCGTGVRVRLPDAVWRCRFVDRAGSGFEIRWSSGPVARMTADADYVVSSLDGTSRRVARGDVLPVGGSPLLLRNA